jgi:hypothetical protein
MLPVSTEIITPVPTERTPDTSSSDSSTLTKIQQQLDRWLWREMEWLNRQEYYQDCHLYDDRI